MLADCDAVRDRVRRHLAVDADPVDRAVGALVVPTLGLVEFHRQPGEPQLELVDGLPEPHQLQAQRRTLKTRLEHM